MSQETREIPTDSSLLHSKETEMSISDVSISPAKKREQASSSQAIQEETEMSIPDVFVSPAKNIRTNMSQEPRETTQASYVLPSKETEWCLFGVTISPAKNRDLSSISQAIQEETENSISDVTITPRNKRERTSISKALQVYHSMDSEETEKSIYDVTISPAKKMSQEPRMPSKKTLEFRLFGVSIHLSSAFSTSTDGELEKTNCLKDPEKVFVSTTLCLYDETWPCGNPDYANVTCGSRNEELTEQTRKIEEVKEDLARYGVSPDPWNIKKDLRKRDLGRKLHLSEVDVESHILRYLSEDDQKKFGQVNGIMVYVHDHESHTSHQVYLMKCISKQNYCLKSGWRKKFVHRRGLRTGDKIGLYWDRSCYQLQFRVLSCATAKAPAEEKKLLNQ